MCGIVAAVAQRDVAPLLIAGLKALEYRGYDSAGLAVLDGGQVRRVRAKGKVREMEALYLADPLAGGTGIAHTRWATHGVPNEANAHPHLAGRVAIVHNGIIENHASLRAELQAGGHAFTSETDTEVMAALIDRHLDQGLGLREAVLATVRELEGAYAIAVLSRDEPGRVVGARRGAPLLVGLGIGENFLGSDAQALIQVTHRMLYLDEGDVVEITRDGVQVFGLDGHPVERAVHESELSTDAVERGEYRHYMQKEIFEQPHAVASTLEARLGPHGVLPNTFGVDSDALLQATRGLHIIACGTSYHAGLVAKYWIEELARLPVSVEVASEYRYRETVVPADTLFVAISQSGETADTLAALRNAKELGFLASLAICNVGISSLVRESDLTLLTQAGREIGVASTKAFTTQLVGLLLLTLSLGQVRGTLGKGVEATLVEELRRLPTRLGEALAMDSTVEKIAELFAEKNHTLFLGRGAQFPVAMEGALKLKEISYIHAEAYPAGELKHGPLALVDNDMPVVTVAPNNELLEKLKSNLQEVRARGGQLVVFADEKAGMTNGEGTHVINMPHIHDTLSPILYTIPLQLLSYYVAVLKGTDVDQPRNLAKSVTVE